MITRTVSCAINLALGGPPYLSVTVTLGAANNIDAHKLYEVSKLWRSTATTATLSIHHEGRTLVATFRIGEPAQ